MKRMLPATVARMDVRLKSAPHRTRSAVWAALVSTIADIPKTISPPPSRSNQV
ncbi:MAG: hypothetical protein NTV69_15905 [Caldilinea sp.]|nr:hypothetical protein [Caldilinea sp.]